VKYMSKTPLINRDKCIDCKEKKSVISKRCNECYRKYILEMMKNGSKNNR